MRRWKIKVGQIVACSFCGEWGRIDAFSVPCKDGKLDRGWRGPALQGFDVGGYRDRFNVFKVPVPASFTPGQKLLDRAVISGPCVRVADRHRKKLEELFLVDAPAAGPFMFSSQFANIAQFAFTWSTHRKFKSHWLTLAFTGRTPWPGLCARSVVSSGPCSSSTGSQIRR